jgi:nicotinamidase/pyrazinamidase
MFKGSTQTRWLKTLGYPIYATQDWHPANHISFFPNHDNAKAYDVIEIKGRQQVLWPPIVSRTAPMPGF